MLNARNNNNNQVKCKLTGNFLKYILTLVKPIHFHQQKKIYCINKLENVNEKVKEKVEKKYNKKIAAKKFERTKIYK